ncbi:hypothetical protein BDZ94DRAFT_1272723 [Collybia nuda]|uniref:DUF6534 domain-containing protein n=1 Tax=Collybia nuda TaxID=64659 RepID=A0A9P6CE54_9AGAR|nr:hypothetical protein BDZ94DRAFT_1272723 [Collybia nuda]
MDLGPYSGVELLCTYFAMALWGVTCMQSFLYFFNNLKDPISLKLLVVWLWVMDTVHQCLLMSGSYKATVSGAVTLTNNVRTEYVIQILFTALVAVPVQTYFAFRIWIFAQERMIIPIFMAPAILFQLSEGIVLVIINLNATIGVQLTASTSQALFIANFVTSAVVDIMISAGLCLLLWQQMYRGESHRFDATTTMVQRLILFSILTGTWTALFAIAAMAMLLIFPKNFIYVGFYFMLCPVYCNTLLANLNARCYLRENHTHDQKMNLDLFKSTIRQSGSTACDPHFRSAFTMDDDRDGSSMGQVVNQGSQVPDHQRV